MRQTVVVLILLSVMISLKTLGLTSDINSNALLLVSIGFIILASFSAGDLIRKIKIPRVTGYILAGLLLGPQIFDILSSSIVSNITMFNTLALGLIALGAGLELEVTSLRAVGRTLFSTVAFKTLLIFATVGLGIFFMEQSGQFIGAPNIAVLITICLVMATISIGTSPAVSLAVIEETGIRTRISQLVLGSAVVKDIVMVVLLAIAISISGTLTNPSASMSSGVFVDLLGELVLSTLVGLAIGGLLVAYRHFVNREMLLFVSAIILGAAELSVALHLELLLVFIVAGFTVSNFSKYGHDMMKPIQTVSLPVFVVFFTNAGALINLPKVLELLPLAGAVALLRAVSFFVAHRLGSRVGRESPEITTWGWLGYLPQAGVTLGLLALASERLPEIAPYFQSLGMGLVAINLLLGPLALRIALVKSSEEDTFDVPRPQDLIKAGTTSEPLEYADIDFPQLQKKMKAATLSFIESQERDFAERNQKGKSSFLHFLEILPEESIVPNETYRSSLEKINVQLLAYSEDFIKTIELVDPTLSSIEENVSVPYTRENWTQMPGDSWTVRLRKLRIRILNTFRGGEQRTIPLKTVYKIHFNTYAAKSGRHQLNLWFNSGLASYDELRKFLEGTQTRSETQVRIEEIWNLSNTTLVAESTASMADTARAISNDVRKIDTAYLRAKDYLFSETEPRLRKYLTETNEKRQVWANKLPALIDSVLIHSILFHLKISIQNTLDEQCIIPLEDLRKDIVQIFDKIDHLIDSDYGPNQARELVKLMAAMNVQIRDQYVFLSSMRMLSRHFSDSLGKYFHLDRRYELLPIEVFGMRITEPGEMRTVKVQFASNINRTFFSTFFPPIESLIDQVSEGLDIFQEDIEEIQKTLLFIAESSAKQDSVYIPLSDAEAKNLYSNVKIKISEAMARVLQSLEGVRERIRHEIDGAFVEIRSIVQSPNVIRSASTHWYSFIVRTESKLREHLSFFYKFGKRLRKIIKGFLKTFEESPSVLELRKRMKAGSLDAQVINEYLKEVLSAPQKLERLPQIYRRLFTLDSLRDNRLFSVHSEAFHHLPLPGSESSIHRVLIVGKSGMGKSSLLNLAELASLNSRVIRLDRNYGTTHLSIISLLARQLNVNQSTKSICMALKQSPATVIIDNLDHWWAPQSHEDMTQLIEIISMSSIDIRWIVSIDFFNYRLLNQAYSMRSLFHRVEFLEPLGHEALEKLILHRNSLSGLEPEFSRGFGTQIFDHLWRSGPQDIYFELLRSASGGNLRSALQIWIQSVGRIDNRTVRLHSHPVVSPDLTFLEQFNYESLLILKELYRFGPRSIRQLIEETHIRDTFLAREVESLRQTGLVTNKSKDGHIIQIDVLAKYYIGEQLHHLQII